ncbi:MAG TPA: DUF2865 domain-containing protein [Methylocystis sp.]|nr:DUF2865 domain-containing protein [Methylocystis sp.]
MSSFVRVFHRLSANLGHDRPHAGAAAKIGAPIAMAMLLIAAIGAPPSFAQGGFFEELFGGWSRSYQSFNSGGWGYGRHYGRHARHHSRYFHRARPFAWASRTPPRRRHEAAIEPVEPETDGRAVCVRACDGFFFPAVNVPGRHGSQASCSSVCPDAEAKLFIIPEGSENIADAKAEDGQLYTQFVAKLAAQTEKPKSCSCHVIADDATQTKALLNDPTLRPGDSVVTSEGVKVFAGDSSGPHSKGSFLSLAETRDISPSQRGALAAIDRAIKTPVGRAVALKDDHRRHGSHHRHAETGGDEKGAELEPQAAR